MSKFHTRFSPPPSRGVHFLKPSLVQKQFMQEADINYLIGRFTKTGSFYSAEQLAKARATPQFGDFVAVQSCNVVEAHAVMAKAKEAFELLPFNVRERFNHSPERLLEFIQDEGNYDEALRLGLVNERKKDEVIKPNPDSSEVSPSIS